MVNMWEHWAHWGLGTSAFKINSNVPVNARKLLSPNAVQSKERQVLCKERHVPSAKA